MSETGDCQTIGIGRIELVLSNGDATLVDRDRRIPGLTAVLDGDALADALQRHLPDARIGPVRTTYLRYKPGTNCLAAFKAIINDEEKLGYAKAFSENISEPFRQAADLTRQSSHHTPCDEPHHTECDDHVQGCENRARTSRTEVLNLGDPVGVPIDLPEHRIRVRFFPCDSKISALSLTQRPGERAALLDKVLSNGNDLSGSTLDPLRYKPERRFVAAVRSGQRPIAVLRLYTADAYPKASQIHKYLSSARTLRIARRIGRSNRRHAVACEWLPGQLLTDFSRHDDLEGTLGRVGRALAELHEQTASKLPRLTRQAETDHWSAVADGLGDLEESWDDFPKEVARRISESLVEPNRICLVHGDLHFGQIVLGRDEIGMIDFDRAARGDPALDLGSLIAELHRRQLFGELSRAQVEHLAHVLIRGYGDRCGHEVARQADVYSAAALFRMAAEPFRLRHPRWPEQGTLLLKRAHEILNDVGLDGLGGSYLPRGRQRSSDRAFRKLPFEVLVQDPAGARDDPAMPFLPEALDPGRAEPLLADLLSDRILAGRKLQSISVNRHKPGRRCLIAYRWGEKSIEGVHDVVILGKVRAKGLDKKAFGMQQTLWDAGFGDRAADHISVAEPLAALPAWNMWFQRRVPGKMASEVLKDRDADETAARIVAAIGKLHRTPIPGLQSHTIADELGILRRMLEEAAEKIPAIGRAVGDLFAICSEIGGSLRCDETATLHRDFYPDQILVRDGHVCLVDLDLCAAGDPALDLGNFCGHLIEQGLRETGNSREYAAWHDAILHHFASENGEPARHRAKWYATLTLARHVCLSTRLPGRRHTTEPLIQLCMQRFRGNGV